MNILRYVHVQAYLIITLKIVSFLRIQFCQAQPQLQLSWAELALTSISTPPPPPANPPTRQPTHPATHPPAEKVKSEHNPSQNKLQLRKQVARSQ